MSATAYPEDLDKSLERHIREINKSLNNKSHPEKSIEVMLSFGSFLQEQFPGMLLDDLRKEINKISKNSTQFQEMKLPEVQLIGALSEARIVWYGQAEIDENTYEICKCDALAKAMNIYAVLMGEERVTEKLLPVSDEIIDGTITKISAAKYKAPPQQYDAAAENTIRKLKVNNITCLQHLSDALKVEAKKLPDTVTKPFISANTGELDVASFATAVINKPEQFPEVSKQLRIASESYLTIKTLGMELEGTEKPIIKLQNYRQQFEQPHVQKTLNTNPDNAIQTFIKVVNYIFAKITNSVKKNSSDFEILPLNSPQQTLLKKAARELQEAPQAPSTSPSMK
ncbi:hypothetical protein [Legionella shakespearei]|uniref:Uncharacterized protein n=1 Tax=Legionella shakespearei DSM 23087 TaxID=1122169 RepID=A0A0W0Z2P0_9GAMM|nr:hypothetical protein [Legionella shakespearei]KTD63388.1 hypothetical protein Lsha_0730 [Legionella shakespearei DSM 23087]